MLNKNQIMAVKHFEGPALVLASPGSGKTTVVINRVKELIHSHDISPKDILVITFTKAAAIQMADRFSGLQVPGGKSVSFGTFHSVFFRILRDGGKVRLDDVLKEDEAWNVVKNIIKQNQINTFDEDEYIKDFFSSQSLMKNDLVKLEEFQPKGLSKDEFNLIYKKYQRYKEDNGKLDFDDMLTECYYLLINDDKTLKRWQTRCKFILIDEFQDINKVQYECIKLLSKPQNNLFVVGDDDQSIYKFRGARPEFLLDFEKDFKNVKKIVLDTNYRSTELIIRLGKKIIDNNKVRYTKDVKGTGNKGEVSEFFSADNTMDEAEKIVSKIKVLIRNGTPLKEIAVIYRTNMQATAIARALSKNGISYNLRDNILNVYEHWVAKDIIAYIKLAGDIQDDNSFNKIVNKPRRYITKEMLKNANDKPGSALKNLYADWSLKKYQASELSDLEIHLSQIRKRDPKRAVNYIRNVIGYNDYINEYSSYRKINPDTLMEIADQILDTASESENFNQFIEKVNDLSRDLKENRKNANKLIENAITLTTMHSAKGLEFEAVFIPSVVEGIVPHERGGSKSDIEEERRLFYVAVTRAKSRLCISEVKTLHEKKTKRSRFLEEIGLKTCK